MSAHPDRTVSRKVRFPSFRKFSARLFRTSSFEFRTFSSSNFRRIQLPVLDRLQPENRRDSENVVFRSAARHVGARLRKPEQDLPVRLRAGEILHELEPDVAGIEIWKNEHVRLAGDEAAGRL